MKWKTIKRVLDKFLETITAASMAILVIVVTWQVITRFLLKNPSSWTEELAIYLMIWVGMLGSAVALNRKAHLGIDYFVGKLKIRQRTYLELLVYLGIAIFAITVLIAGGMNIVSFYFTVPQLSPALGINVAWVYLAIPISGFFITFYCIDFFITALRSLQKQ